MSDIKQNQQSETAKSAAEPAAKPLPKCPTCGAPADAKALPFCSSRCADVDLGNWFQGKYAIPAVDAADDTIIEALLAGDMAPIQGGDDR
ncbi:MAG: DNA gyrase inhibitor YacG [Proteobacteria bacterium]|nr:DNA gyrase inhibitor YacG [Pseudomonadota bacterium]MDA0884706.1 DNA gyrase inhibitor YacG [Pseudomonadota bacterium]MDA1150941.1 DNA gyrase inhibitor YacG [Pseudomonadota bacterium]